MSSKEIINSVGWRKGKLVVNNKHEFLIRKKIAEPVLSENNNQTLVIELDNVLLTQGESENPTILIDGGNIRYESFRSIETDNGASYLSPGNYIISCIEPPSQEDEMINISVTEECVSQITEELIVSNRLLGQVDPVCVANENASNNLLPETSCAVKKTYKKQGQEEAVKKVEVTDLIRPPLGKRRCCFSDSEDSDSPEADWDSSPADYETIADVVYDLSSKELINDEFKELIFKGLSDMKLDILKELKNPKRSKHSYELLTFAFLLYYKQRNAYYYLRKVFSLQWPDKQELRDWRKLVNKKKKNWRSRHQSTIST